jgi:hypothetical protein
MQNMMQEVENCQAIILLTEEVLLEALCFDFVVQSPHSELVDLFDAHEDDLVVQDYAWSIAHDSSVPLPCLVRHLSKCVLDTGRLYACFINHRLLRPRVTCLPSVSQMVLIQLPSMPGSRLLHHPHRCPPRPRTSLHRLMPLVSPLNISLSTTQN